MIPDYVEQEAELRLGGIYDRAMPLSVRIDLLQRIGIDLEAARTPHPTPEEAMSPICLSEEDGERIVGAVEFDLEMRALGHSIIQKARASYLVTALSEEQLSNADEQQFFGYVFVDFDLLVWEDQEDRTVDGAPVRLPAPRWQAIPPGFIPEKLRLRAEASALGNAFTRAYGRRSDL
ncbi:MAG TPA: hypothetical protein VIR65_07400 [Rhizorhapis sp.]